MKKAIFLATAAFAVCLNAPASAGPNLPTKPIEQKYYADGAWTVAQAAAKRMAEAESGGVIVNIASVLGLRVSKGVVPYAVSKAGLIQMTKALALEWARHDIRVNALAPGYVETDLTRDYLATEAGRTLMTRIPQRRPAEMAELDGPLLLLASDASSYMTGSVVAVDGGHLVSSL